MYSLHTAYTHKYTRIHILCKHVKCRWRWFLSWLVSGFPAGLYKKTINKFACHFYVFSIRRLRLIIIIIVDVTKRCQHMHNKHYWQHLIGFEQLALPDKYGRLVFIYYFYLFSTWPPLGSKRVCVFWPVSMCMLNVWHQLIA